MRLWVYLKSSGQLQYIITSQREGEGEGKEEGGGVRNVTDCLQKIDCQKMAGDAVKLKMPPMERERERGGRAREMQSSVLKFKSLPVTSSHPVSLVMEYV